MCSESGLKQASTPVLWPSACSCSHVPSSAAAGSVRSPRCRPALAWPFRCVCAEALPSAKMSLLPGDVGLLVSGTASPRQLFTTGHSAGLASCKLCDETTVLLGDGGLLCLGTALPLLAPMITLSARSASCRM